MAADPPAEYQVRVIGKELLVYREGEQEQLFIAGWGVTPPVLYVPPADRWDELMPEWLRGRRDQVVARLAADSRHVLLDDQEA